MDNRAGTILVVDRTIKSADLISQWLQGEAVSVYTAESGHGALAKMEIFKPDILITNVELPDMSGFDLCKTVKADDEMRYTMVLCVNNAESAASRLRAAEVEADDYIETGTEHYLFISKVRSLLRLKRLSNQLRQKYAELEGKNILLDKQLEMGMRVQRALIPDINLNLQNTQLLSRYFPAMGVGGDFYNLLPLSGHSFGIVMGDVSGHGIAAAFVTAMVNMMLKTLAAKYIAPDQLFYYLNKEFYALFEKSESAIYACVFYAVVNTKARTITYSNAGQCLPLYVNADKNVVTELESAGTPIGMFKDSTYEVKTLEYNPTDLLLFYTDGLQDMYYKDQPDEFARRMEVILSEIRYLESPEEILDIVCDNFYNETASEAERMEMDDVSMILCRL